MKAAKRLMSFACLTFIGISISLADEKGSKEPVADSQAKTTSFKQPETFAELLAVPLDQLEKVDIARMNLLCAQGLRGSEELDLEHCLKTLDVLAGHVKAETERNRHFFTENPERFKNSEGRFRMMFLATVLQQDFGVQYSPERKEAFVEENGKTVRKQPDEVFFSDSKDIFLHGLLAGKHYGTCASMPLLYVAVAKRLGYPAYFATTQAHAYVRYEEGTNHFNVEATCVGFKTYPDAFFKQWPFPLRDEFIAQGRHLESLDNKMILARCLTGRAACLTSMKKFDDAAETWKQAQRYLPDTPLMSRYAESAKFQRGKSQWFTWWEEVARLPIPQGPKFSYFQNKKVRIHMFMNYSYDMEAIGKHVAKFKEDVAEYQRQMSPSYDGPRPIAVWPENFDDLPEFPEMESMPSLAASPEYWRAIPAELVRRLQQKRAIQEKDVLEETIMLSVSAGRDQDEELNAFLPPHVRETLGLARSFSHPPHHNSALGMRPALVEAFTRLADNEQFTHALSHYHSAKLRELEQQATSGFDRSHPETAAPKHSGYGRKSPLGVPQAISETRDFNGLGLPPQAQRVLQMADGLKRSDDSTPLSRQTSLQEQRLLHLQAISALSINRRVRPVEPNASQKE